MAKYWSTNSLTRTPFFGKILSSNTFQNILVNLYISDNNTDYPHDNPNHDPLHKMRSFTQMCERTIQLVYRPGCDLSYDEACCPVKGRVWFCIYNANKLAKFHLKLFQICEVTYVHLIFTLERTRQDVHKLHKFWIQAVQQQQSLLWGLWIQHTFWTKGIACTWTIFIQVQNFMRSFFSIPCMLVVQCAKIGRACQKQ